MCYMLVNFTDMAQTYILCHTLMYKVSPFVFGLVRAVLYGTVEFLPIVLLGDIILPPQVY